MGAAIQPLVLAETPNAVITDTSSEAGQLQGSVNSWAREVVNAMRSMSTSLQKLQQASPSAAPAPLAAAATSITQVISAAGANGWTPVFALINFSGTVIMELTSWIGGTGTPPASPLYVGPSGFVTSPSSAVNLLGASGSTGGITMQLIFSAGVTAPPAAGGVLFDNVTFGSIANVHVSTTDRNGVDISATMAKLGIGSVIEVFQEGSSIAFATFAVTGTTTHSGYLSLAVTPLSGQILTDLQAVGFSFTLGSGAASLAGDVTGPIGSNVVTLLSGVTSVLQAPIGYASGGNIQVRFDLGSWDAIGLTTNASFSPAGSAGMLKGRTQTLDLLNTSGGTFTLAWNASWKLVNGALPTSIANNTFIRVVLRCTSAVEAGIVASYFTSASSGAPSGPAGGSLNGTYPNPGLAATGVVAGTYMRSTVDVGSDGRIIAITNDPSIFNVKDLQYAGGAKGDGTTLDDAAIASAITSLTAFIVGNTKGTLYFPDGCYKVSAEIALALSGYQTCTVKGNGRFSSIILQTTGAAHGVHVTLTGVGASPNLLAEARCEVCDLGFQTSSGTTCGNAVYFDYGTGNFASSEDCEGNIATRLEIVPNTYGGSGGWVNGVLFNNGWHMKAIDLFGYGNASTLPGAMVRCNGGVNVNLSLITGLFWGILISLQPITGGITQQGIICSELNGVACRTFFLLTPVGGSFADWISIVNFQCDQGAIAGANIGIHIQGAANGGVIANGLILQDGGTVGVWLDNCSQFNVSNVFILGSAAPTFAAHLQNGSNNNIFRDCWFGGNPINLDATSGLNYINNTGGSAITNAGTGNHTITTPF